MRSRSSLTNLFFFYWSVSFTYQDIHYILTRSLAGDKKTSQLETDARVPHKCLSVFVHSNSCNNFFHEGFLFLPDENFTVSAPAGPKTSIQVLLPCNSRENAFMHPCTSYFQSALEAELDTTNTTSPLPSLHIGKRRKVSRNERLFGQIFKLNPVLLRLRHWQ